MSAEASSGSGDEAPPVLLRVERGDPTAEELAALLAVVAARVAAGGSSRPPQTRRSSWSSPIRLVRGVHRTGPEAWRESARPV